MREFGDLFQAVRTIREVANVVIWVLVGLFAGRDVQAFCFV